MSKFNSEDCWQAIESWPGYTRTVNLKKKIQEKNTDNSNNQANQSEISTLPLNKDK